jgi:hypothetical protein
MDQDTELPEIVVVMTAEERAEFVREMDGWIDEHYPWPDVPDPLLEAA